MIKLHGYWLSTMLLLLSAGSSLSYAAMHTPRATPDIEWVEVDNRSLAASDTSNGRYRKENILPFYVIEADNISSGSPSQTLVSWQHYSDEIRVSFNPSKEYLLDSSRVHDRWIRLSERSPHNVHWVIKIKPLSNNRYLYATQNGVIIGRDPAYVGVPVDKDHIYTVHIIRQGERLQVLIDGFDPMEHIISSTDRTPLQVTAQTQPITISHSSLFFAKGEALSPPAPTGKNTKPQWVTAYSEDFTRAESIDAFVQHPEKGTLEWDNTNHSLSFDPAHCENNQMYVMLKKSLPGDLKASFRARSMKENQPPFFGILVNHEGTLKAEDAYFIEWNYWQVQIKKGNVLKASHGISYEGNYSQQKWLQCRFEIHKGTITMYTDNVPVLTWTDPYPFAGTGHDLFAFYSWKVPMQITDLVIERNEHDPIQPLIDQPAFKDNYLYGIRKAAVGDASASPSR